MRIKIVNIKNKRKSSAMAKNHPSAIIIRAQNRYPLNSIAVRLTEIYDDRDSRKL